MYSILLVMSGGAIGAGLRFGLSTGSALFGAGLAVVDLCRQYIGRLSYGDFGSMGIAG
jgi:fluoride ion exporter CrcB/FEX